MMILARVFVSGFFIIHNDDWIMTFVGAEITPIDLDDNFSRIFSFKVEKQVTDRRAVIHSLDTFFS